MSKNLRILSAGKDLRQYKRQNTPKVCPICRREFKYVEARNITLDHDHGSGRVRGILCRNCNGLEGKVNNMCTRAGKHVKRTDFLKNMIKYWTYHDNKPKNIFYPGCKLINNKIVVPKKKRKRRRR